MSEPQVAALVDVVATVIMALSLASLIHSGVTTLRLSRREERFAAECDRLGFPAAAGRARARRSRQVNHYRTSFAAAAFVALCLIAFQVI